MLNQIAHDVSDASQLGALRRQAALLAAEAGLSADICNDAAIVVSELATNLINHGRGGTLLLRWASTGGGALEAIAIDSGGGMADIERCLADGYSTRGTPGNGLGAVRRLAHVFDVWTAPSGTVVLAQFGAFVEDAAMCFGSVCIPIKNEMRCGDSWAVRNDADGPVVLMVDGLGHGDDAALAADAAVAALESEAARDPRAVLDTVDKHMRGTRGGAVAIAAIALNEQSIKYCGIGNISGRVEAPEGTRGMVSNNGIVGGQFRKTETFDYPLPRNALLILHSDGLQSRWDLNKYPGLRARHPALIAAVLFRDFARGHDDVTVVVVARKHTTGPGA